MSADIVTFTTQAGTRGETIAQMVANQLGYQCYERDLISQAAATHGVSVREIAEAERWPDFFERLGAVLSVSRLSRGNGSEGIEVLGAASPTFYFHSFVEQEISRVVLEGKCVLVDHGAHPLLKREGIAALHILVEGSVSIRSRQLQWEMQLSERSALSAARDADRRKAGFLNHLYEFDYLDPRHYDLVVNTDHLSNLAACQLVTAAACSRIAEVTAD